MELDSSFSAELSSAPKFTTAPRPILFDPKAKFTGEAIPGPGSYFTEKSTLAQTGTRIPRARRFTAINSEEFLSDNTTSGRGRSSNRSRSATPGPASYRSEGGLTSHVPGGVIPRSRSRSAGLVEIRGDSGPGPSSYAVSSSTFAKTGVKIPAARREFNLGHPDRTPGPGDYDTARTRTALTPNAAIIGRARREFTFVKSEQSPGPCAYNPPLTTIQTNTRGTFGRALKSRSLNRDYTPGPGDYNPRWTKQSHVEKK